MKDKIYNHIENLSNIDRTICSPGFESAINYVVDNIQCTKEQLSIKSYDSKGEYWGWRLPESLNHWKDDREDKKFYISHDNPMKVVEVFIEGASKKEILFISHLCHPAPAANDNASGAAMMIELANYYQKNRTHYSIRFLFTVEYWGTVAYFSENENIINEIEICISLDMVGADQELCGSTMIVDEIPHHLSSNIDLLLWDRLQKNSKTGKYRFIGNSVQSFRCDFQYYTGGSDHYISNSLGIPSTCVNTYPDHFYHTKYDTIDKISKDTLSLFWNTIIQSVADYSDNTNNHSTIVFELILNHYQKTSSELIKNHIEKEVEHKDIYFLLGHVFNNCKNRVERINNKDIRMSGLLLLDKEYQLVVNRVKRFVKPRVHCKDTVRYIKNFSGPLPRNILFQNIDEIEKQKISNWLHQDNLFFHKVDAAIEYCSLYSLKEISLLLRFHYKGCDYFLILVEFFEFLLKYNLVSKKSNE